MSGTEESEISRAGADDAKSMEVHRRICKDINNYADLRSLLMSSNLLPEQVIKCTDQWRYMVAITCAYMLGRQAQAREGAQTPYAEHLRREAVNADA